MTPPSIVQHVKGSINHGWFESSEALGMGEVTNLASSGPQLASIRATARPLLRPEAYSHLPPPPPSSTYIGW